MKRRTPTLMLVCVLAGACGSDALPVDADEGEDLAGLHCSAVVDADGDGWLELGQGVVGYTPLTPDDELRIVLGGQGLLMFPLDLRAGGFCVPPDLSERDEFPVLGARIELEGLPDDPIEILDQPIDFLILEDDTYLWIYLPMVLPDAADPQQLAGRTAFVHVRLEPHDHPPIEVDMQLTIGLEP